MIYRKLSLIAFLVALTCSGFVANESSQPFFAGSLGHIQQIASENQQPYFIYFYKKDARQCRKMQRKTWENRELKAYIQDHYIGYKLDVFSDSANVEMIQKYSVFQYPTTIIFSPEGRIMGKAQGYLAPSTLLAILNKHVRALKQKENLRKKLKDQLPAPSRKIDPPVPKFDPVNADREPVMVASASPKRSVSQRTRGLEMRKESLVVPAVRAKSPAPSQAPPLMASVTRGMSKTNIHLDVPGMDDYSLKSLNVNQEEPSTIGLLIGSYTSYKELRVSLERYQKYWKNDMYVYCEEVNETLVYKLVLGTYQTKEEAEAFANSIYKFAKINTFVLDLAYLLK